MEPMFNGLQNSGGHKSRVLKSWKLSFEGFVDLNGSATSVLNSIGDGAPSMPKINEIDVNTVDLQSPRSGRNVKTHDTDEFTSVPETPETKPSVKPLSQDAATLCLQTATARCSYSADIAQQDIDEFLRDVLEHHGISQAYKSTSCFDTISQMSPPINRSESERKRRKLADSAGSSRFVDNFICKILSREMGLHANPNSNCQQVDSKTSESLKIQPLSQAKRHDIVSSDTRLASQSSTKQSPSFLSGYLTSSDNYDSESLELNRCQEQTIPTQQLGTALIPEGHESVCSQIIESSFCESNSSELAHSYCSSDRTIASQFVSSESSANRDSDDKPSDDNICQPSSIKNLSLESNKFNVKPSYSNLTDPLEKETNREFEIQSKKFLKTGLAQMMQKLARRENASYAITKHELLTAQVGRCLESSGSSLVRLRNRRLRLIACAEKTPDTDTLSCLLPNDDGEYKDVLLIASSLRKERHKIRIGDQIFVFSPWSHYNCCLLGTDVIVTSSYCEVTSLSKECDIIVQLSSPKYRTKQVGVKGCPCSSSGPCPIYPSYSGPLAFLQ